jgi:hypothetical protein
MPITQEASGSQTATIGTEHTLATIVTQKTFIAYVDCNGLAASEYVELKVKRDARSADATRTLHTRVVSWLEAAMTPIIKLPADSGGGGEYVVTLRQLNGTGRAFPWAIETPG